MKRGRDCNDLNPKEVKELFNQYLESNPIEFRGPFLGKLGEALWFDNESGRKGLMSHYIDQFDDGMVEGGWGERIDTKNKYLQYSCRKGRYGNRNSYPHFPPHTKGARISSDYRGFLLNHFWLFYQGDTYSIYYAVKLDGNMIVGLQGMLYESQLNKYGIKNEEFTSPNMLDITTLICNSKPKNSFMNWTENPLEGV